MLALCGNYMAQSTATSPSLSQKECLLSCTEGLGVCLYHLLIYPHSPFVPLLLPFRTISELPFFEVLLPTWSLKPKFPFQK